MGGVPSATYNEVMMNHFPEDWETTKKWYPLAEVKNVREAMLDANYILWQEEKARSHGGKSAGEGGEREGSGGEGESPRDDGIFIRDAEEVESTEDGE